MTKAGPSRVIITGGAGGIGSALARRFGRAGAHIALLDLKEDALATAAEALRDAGVTVDTYSCDVTDRDQCYASIEKAAHDMGGIDTLINNAGITHISRFADTDPSVYERVMGVNFFGSLYCTKAALPHLVESRGRIAVLSSIAGFAPLLGRTGYCASKYALHGLFETLRAELQDEGVSVTMACPIFTESNLHEGTLAADGSVAGYARSKVGRMYSADEVAEGIFAAMLARKRMIVFSGRGKTSYWLSRIAPTLYERLMRRNFEEELARKG